MSNDDQIEYWNGDAGSLWAMRADQLDQLLSPFLDAILGAAALKSGETVIDVGCGGGALALAAAQKVDPSGRILGVDVSAPLLETARQRAKALGLAAKFEQADASIYKSEQPFNVMVSRFGVMFFDEPTEAFENIRHNMSEDGRLAFACWSPLSENDWALFPLKLLLPLLPEGIDLPAPPPPGTPGPFAFADETYLRSVLEGAGWKNVELKKWTGELHIPGDNPDDVAEFMLSMGPGSRLAREAGIDPSSAQQALTKAVSPMVESDGRVTLPGAAWVVTASV